MESESRVIFEITTSKGPLIKREGSDEDDRARAEWVEYELNGEIIHRSANIALKKGIESVFETGELA